MSPTSPLPPLPSEESSSSSSSPASLFPTTALFLTLPIALTTLLLLNSLSLPTTLLFFLVLWTACTLLTTLHSHHLPSTLRRAACAAPLEYLGSLSVIWHTIILVDWIEKKKKGSGVCVRGHGAGGNDVGPMSDGLAGAVTMEHEEIAEFREGEAEEEEGLILSLHLTADIAPLLARALYDIQNAHLSFRFQWWRNLAIGLARHGLSLVESCARFWLMGGTWPISLVDVALSEVEVWSGDLFDGKDGLGGEVYEYDYFHAAQQRGDGLPDGNDMRGSCRRVLSVPSFPTPLVRLDSLSGLLPEPPAPAFLPQHALDHHGSTPPPLPSRSLPKIPPKRCEVEVACGGVFVGIRSIQQWRAWLLQAAALSSGVGVELDGLNSSGSIAGLVAGLGNGAGENRVMDGVVTLRAKVSVTLFGAVVVLRNVCVAKSFSTEALFRVWQTEVEKTTRPLSTLAQNATKTYSPLGWKTLIPLPITHALSSTRTSLGSISTHVTLGFPFPPPIRLGTSLASSFACPLSRVALEIYLESAPVAYVSVTGFDCLMNETSSLPTRYGSSTTNFNDTYQPEDDGTDNASRVSHRSLRLLPLQIEVRSPNFFSLAKAKVKENDGNVMATAGQFLKKAVKTSVRGVLGSLGHGKGSSVKLSVHSIRLFHEVPVGKEEEESVEKEVKDVDDLSAKSLPSPPASPFEGKDVGTAPTGKVAKEVKWVNELLEGIAIEREINVGRSIKTGTQAVWTEVTDVVFGVLGQILL